MTATLDATAPQTTMDHDELLHLYCCEPNLAWCGESLPDGPDCPDDCGCLPCVVCEDLRYEPPPPSCRCGS